MVFDQGVQLLDLAQLEVTRLNVAVVYTQDRVDVLDALLSHVTHVLDANGDLLDLVVGQRQAKLFNTGLDGVPASQSRANVDVAGKTKVRRLEDLVGRSACGSVSVCYSWHKGMEGIHGLARIALAWIPAL